MCKLTAFTIMEDGNIDYMGGGNMETVYHADNQYCEFLDQQVKELHMERNKVLLKVSSGPNRQLMEDQKKAGERHTTHAGDNWITHSSYLSNHPNQGNSVWGHNLGWSRG